MRCDSDFAEIWAIDFEFIAADGARPVPVCLAAKELRSGRRVRQWQDEFGALPPFDVGPTSLIVSYFASAEMGCFLALGWPRPVNILDLFCEFRCRFNGLVPPSGWGLLGALAAFGLDPMVSAHKDAMRALILSGGPWSPDECRRIADYCAEDVDSLSRLLQRMQDRIDGPRALLRGRYMAAVALMEWHGVPIDRPTLHRLRQHWETIKERLVAMIDRNYGVFDGVHFRRDLFERFLIQNGIPWPRLDSGVLDLSDATFRERSRADARIAPLREVRFALSQLRLSDLAVGPDGRNRALLSPFRARTGRNQPSNAKSIFGPSVWLRSLIQPEPGTALAYVDWSAQEFGIAAALSGDPAMLAAYQSGDPYLAFAKQAGAIPPDGTKASHGCLREVYKTTTLGVNYGMEAFGLMHRLGISALEARELLLKHRETFPRFWRWAEDQVSQTLLTGHHQTVFGWRLQSGHDVNPRALLNHPMQANGAEMLRIACILASEAGLKVCMPIHDAVLIEAPVERIEADTAAMQAVMAVASRIVLNGFELRSDASLIRHPKRYRDPRGEAMWSRTLALIDEEETTHVNRHHSA